MKIPHSPYKSQEYSARNILGSYKLTPDEEREVMMENERRGLLHLIHERNNSFYANPPERKFK